MAWLLRALLAGAMGLAWLASQPAGALTVELDLPELLGTYVYGESRTAAFDLGTEFVSLDSGSIRLSGTGTSGTFESCAFDDPTDCNTFDVQPEALYGFVREMSGQPFGALGPFGTQPQSFEEPLCRLPSCSLDFLLDGSGELRLGHNVLGTVPEFTLEVLVPPTFTLSEVELSVEGTPVPEPGVALQVLCGLAALAFVRRPRQG